MLNETILVGRLTADPELKYTGKGTAVTKITLAVDGPYKGDDGKPKTVFVDVVVWGKQAESVANYKKKGEVVGVRGQIEVRSYEDSQSIRRKAFEIVADRVKFISGKNGNGAHEEAPLPDSSPNGNLSFNEDDIPF